MNISKKDLEELYDLVQDLFFAASDIPDSYYYDLQEKFSAIKARIEVQSC